MNSAEKSSVSGVLREALSYSFEATRISVGISVLDVFHDLESIQNLKVVL